MLVTGCAAIVEAAQTGGRWEAIGVAGTGYSAVFRDGLPQAPGLYQVVVVKDGQARFFRDGRQVATGTYREVSGQRDNVRIEVSPGARVTVVGQ